jgi:hypothetical protein
MPARFARRKAIVLDPDVQQELRDSSKTAVILHLAMLSEPVIYVIVAMVLKKTGAIASEGEAPTLVPLVRSIAVFVSVLVIAAVILLRRVLFSPERLAPSGATVRDIGMLYARSQIVIDTLAALPATLGLVLFLIGGSMEFLFLLAITSLAILVLIFPRYDVLEQAVMARIMKGETVRTAGEESQGDA